MFFDLPNEIVYNILRYTGELRILKRKMTRENIFQIINDDINVIGFIYDIVDRPMRSRPPIYYLVYWTYLSTLSGNMIENHYKLPEETFDKLNYILTNHYYIDKLMTVFINDYNNYYLDDNYYKLYWMDAKCYDDDDEVDKKCEIEKYRFKVFNETYDHIYPLITI